jgi:hypothetical protein
VWLRAQGTITVTDPDRGVETDRARRAACTRHSLGPTLSATVRRGELQKLREKVAQGAIRTSFDATRENAKMAR